MIGSYLGELSREDPLHGYLQHHIAPQLGFASPDASYRVFQFAYSRNVYLYEEIHGGPKLVGKFFKLSNAEPPANRVKPNSTTSFSCAAWACPPGRTMWSAPMGSIRRSTTCWCSNTWRQSL